MLVWIVEILGSLVEGVHVSGVVEGLHFLVVLVEFEIFIEATSGRASSWVSWSLP